MQIFVRTLGVALAAFGLAIGSAHASVVITGTRVVFDAAQGEATVRLMNQNTRPALVEAWIDAGDLHSTPDSVHTPFLITPPLFRMNAGQDQSLRILYIQGQHPLPTDRESIFWLNVLEIPPKPTGEAAHHNTLQFAIRSRIKLFYRPDKLSVSRTKAPGMLTWKLVQTGNGVALKAHNPTPYYLTFSKVTLTVGDQQDEAKTGMVAPFGDLDLAVQGLSGIPTTAASVTYSTLNDFGASIRHEGTARP